jgi:hypothetical protein
MLRTHPPKGVEHVSQFEKGESGMRKLFITLGIIAALAIPATALAVSVNPSHIGSSCPGSGTWHFVSPGGDSGSRLTAVFSGGTYGPAAPTKTNNGTAHWTFTASGTLQSASTTGAGNRLLLSDYTCASKKAY